MLAHRLPDRLAIARCLHNLANVVKVRGDYSRARWALREATDIFEALGDRSGAAWSINQQGDVAREQGDMAAARGCINGRYQPFGKPETDGVPRVHSPIWAPSTVSTENLWLRTPRTAKLWKSSPAWDTGVGLRGHSKAPLVWLWLKDAAARALKLAAAAAHLRQADQRSAAASGTVEAR